jgi:hypothetical protein
MERKSPLKKRKTMKAKPAGEEEVKTEEKKGPYRNIEESKKHLVTSFPDIIKI